MCLGNFNLLRLVKKYVHLHNVLLVICPIIRMTKHNLLNVPLELCLDGSAGADPWGVQRVPWNPPFERASLTRDTD